jgi:pyridoxine 5-phosphate synthase
LLERWPGAEFNIEGNPFHQLMDYVRAARPDQCTFVPDETGAFTSDHGWDLRKDGERLKPLIDEAHAVGARVSLFMDPIPELMAAAKELGADRVELYTEPYARAYGSAEQTRELARYRAAADAALRAGLDVNAGHDLNRANLAPFLIEVPGVREVSIGHALIADALEFGLPKTVGLYLAEIRKAGAVLRERA